MVFGLRAVIEAIEAGKVIDKILLRRDMNSAIGKELLSKLEGTSTPVQRVPVERLNQFTDKNHQGVIAFLSPIDFYRVEDIVQKAFDEGRVPLLMVLDGVTDPQNLGAIIRTAACVGAHGVIVPERRAVGLTPSAVKASAGAIETVKVARVTNLKRTLESLKEQGIWLYAADMAGEDYRAVSFEGPMALIIGAEGEGVDRKHV